MLWLRMAAAALLVLVAYPARATVSIYTSETEFAAAADGVKLYAVPDHIAPYSSPLPDYEYINIHSGKFAFGPVVLSSDLLALYFDDGIYFGGGYEKPFTIRATGNALGLMLDAYYGDFTVTYTVDGGPTGSFDFDSGPGTPRFLGIVGDKPGIRVTLFGPGEIDVRGALANGPDAAIPEPASWAMMVLGFGLAGLAIRRHKGQAPARG